MKLSIRDFRAVSKIFLHGYLVMAPQIAATDLLRTVVLCTLLCPRYDDEREKEGETNLHFVAE